nr:immunoglobulin heavy chain junction region [Mus musculus]
CARGPLITTVVPYYFDYW